MLNNLSDREKKLVWLVAVLIPVVGLYFAFTTYQGMVKKANVELKQKKDRLTKLEDLEFAAEDAYVKLAALEEFSLPTDIVTHKQTEKYINWLKTLAVDSGLTLVKKTRSRLKLDKETIPDPRKDRKMEKVYDSLHYELGVTGDYESLLSFMYKFYDAGILHQMVNVKITRTRGKKSDSIDDLPLSAKFQIVALILPDAATSRDFSKIANGKIAKDLASYRPILRRNLFGGENLEPKFSSFTDEIDLTTGDDLLSRIVAKDQPLNQLSMTVEETDIKGLKLEIDPKNPRKARLVAPEFTKAGNYSAVIKLTDDGFPAKSITETVDIIVSDPKPRKPIVRKKTKAPPQAPETYITFVGNDLNGTWWTNLEQRLNGKEHRIKIGDSIKLDEKDWKLVAVERRNVTFQVGRENARGARDRRRERGADARRAVPARGDACCDRRTPRPLRRQRS